MLRPEPNAATYNTSTAASCPSSPTPQLLEAWLGREVEAAQVGPVAGQRGHSQQGCQHGAGLKVFAALAGCRHRFAHLRRQSMREGESGPAADSEGEESMLQQHWHSHLRRQTHQEGAACNLQSSTARPAHAPAAPPGSA